MRGVYSGNKVLWSSAASDTPTFTLVSNYLPRIQKLGVLAIEAGVAM